MTCEIVAGDLRTDYEIAVEAIRDRTEAMKREGMPTEEIARAAHAERRRLAALFKARTPEPMRSLIYQRTLAVYGDPLGPPIDALRAQGKTWEEIVESAARPGERPGRSWGMSPSAYREAARECDYHSAVRRDDESRASSSRARLFHVAGRQRREMRRMVYA